MALRISRVRFTAVSRLPSATSMMEIVDGDELVFIIAKDRQLRGKMAGGVVGTQMSNFGLELALEQLKVPFVRAAVGDRYVLAELQNH